MRAAVFRAFGGTSFRCTRERRNACPGLDGPMSKPFGTLSFLYVGTADFERDLAYYRDVLGGELVWNRTGFGAHVAAFRLGKGPVLLIAVRVAGRVPRYEGIGIPSSSATFTMLGRLESSRNSSGV